MSEVAWKPEQNTGLALAWTAGTLTSMLMMGISGRELSAELQPHHSAFYRNAICLLILLPVVLRFGVQRFRTQHLKRHVARNTVHFFAQWCWLFGLSALPLAEVFAIEFSVPIWVALFATVFLGERLTGWRALAIGLGFAGILVILRPGMDIVHPAALMVLLAAVGYASAYVFTKNLVGVDDALTVVWWMNVVQLPIGLTLSATDLVFPSPPLIPWMIVIGVCGFTSHFCLSQALRHADATIIAQLDFLRLPLAAIIAWFAYNEAVDMFLAIGAAFILLGNWINLKKGT
ncbi:MAG: DMT family transporter [Pseudomonadota bacterium]